MNLEELKELGGIEVACHKYDDRGAWFIAAPIGVVPKEDFDAARVAEVALLLQQEPEDRLSIAFGPDGNIYLQDILESDEDVYASGKLETFQGVAENLRGHFADLRLDSSMWMTEGGEEAAEGGAAASQGELDPLIANSMRV